MQNHACRTFRTLYAIARVCGKHDRLGNDTGHNFYPFRYNIHLNTGCEYTHLLLCRQGQEYCGGRPKN